MRRGVRAATRVRRGILFIALFCAACARTGPPAPVAHFGVHTRESFAALVRTVSAPSPPPAKRVPVGEGGGKASAGLANIAPAAPPPRPVIEENIKSSSIPPAARAGEGEKSAAPGGFIWPVRGQVVSGYGPKKGGLYNDGINIAAPRNTPVAAAADGVVAYVGNGIASYGNLVLIRHGGGVVTAYAHLADVKVKAGMPVKKGQPIGAVGSSGAVESAQLHFEIRRGGDAVDPRKFLG